MRFSIKQTLTLLLILSASLVAYLLIGRSADSLTPLVYTFATATQFQPGIVLTKIAVQRPFGMNDDTLFLIGSEGDETETAMMALDSTTGELRWQVSAENLTRPSAWPASWQWNWPFEWQWGRVAATNEAVLVADALLLTTSITAYDAQDGHIHWSRQLGILNGGEVDELVVQDGIVTAHIHDDPYFDTFYALDPETGWMKLEMDQEATAVFMVDLDTLRRYEVFTDTLRVSQYAGWETTFQGCQPTAIVRGDVILVRAEVCEDGGVSRLFALNRENGTLLWAFDGFLASNTAATDTAVYFLTVENELTAVSLTTGERLASLSFSPALPSRPELLPYYVAASGDKTAVYFGDSHQLFVFSLP